MPSMKRDSTLRSAPAGPITDVIAPEAAHIDILGSTTVTVLGAPQAWTKIKLVDAEGAPEGWVQSDRVNDAGIVPAGPIDEVKFTRQCWLEALIADVTPHYVAAVAVLRSGRTQGLSEGAVGPFGFRQTEWDAVRADPGLDLEAIKDVDIFDWRIQCLVFTRLTAVLEAALSSALGTPPSAAQLLLADMVGAPAAAALAQTGTETVTAALAAVRPDDLPYGGDTRDAIVARDKAFLGTPEQPATGQQALGAISTALQPILDATREVVAGVGAEYRGLIDHEGVLGAADAGGPAKPPPPRRSPRLPRTDGPTVMPGAGGLLGELIARGEGGASGYGAFNRGTAGVGGRLDFSKLSLAQVMDLQALKDRSRRLFAVGKYQLIPLTLAAAVAALKLDRTEMYGPAMQELLFRDYLVAVKRPAVKSFITGGSAGLRAAQLALAYEFASVARPDTGRSNYGGVGGNRASISASETAAALQGEAEAYRRILASVGKPDDAWDALSPGFA